MYPLAMRVTSLLLQVDVDVDFDPLVDAGNVAGSAVGAFVTTLVVGAILVAVAPEFTEDRMAAVLDDPVGSFVYGFLVFLLLILVAFVLAITIVGIVFALPLVFVGYVVWAIGSAIAFLAIADRLVGDEDGWTKHLLVAAALNGGLVVTGIGGIIAFAIGAAGFGTVLEGRL
ncbi:hypothetical protein [Halosimplex salinum]|uniref:hypothetical protein n=1 Tax=Halosimplex salinum TaxID=1710538 RepID=UPI000F466B50|nr:hypothetical protein [Halosimplex salinum]